MREPDGGRQGRIVVGVDGSEGSKEALRWAVRQAGLTGSAVEALIAWQYPAFFGWAPVGSGDVDFDKIAEETVNASIAEIVGPHFPDWIRTRVVEGYPPQVLVEASAAAELLVVGSRGYGGFADALLGSVSTPVPGGHTQPTREARCRASTPATAVR